MTPFEWYALEALADTDHMKRAAPSSVGYKLWEQSPTETRKRNPSRQGLALFAGRFLRALHKAGYVSEYNGWCITQAGRDALNNK